MRHRTVRPHPSDLAGRRVVVRFRLHDGEYGATDVLGTLESWADGVLTVRRDRDGSTVAVAESDIVAVKAIPAQPVTRRDVRDLEAAAMLAWQAPETAWVDGWLLRAASGFTGRANSCLPLGDPGVALPDAIARVVAWYHDRALVPAFQLPEPLGGALSPLLDAAGWAAPEDRTLVMTATVDAARAAARPHLPRVNLRDHPDPAWLAGYHDRGADLPDGALNVLVDTMTVAFASIDDDGAPAAIARGAVSEAPSGRRWLGVTAVEVAPSAQRRGFGSHIVAGLAAWGSSHAASDVYVQVTEPNTAAQAMCRRMGFTEHHAYHYRRLRDH